MAPLALTHERPQRPPRTARRNGLLQLGQPHFWLFIAILGGMLGLVAVAFLAA